MRRPILALFMLALTPFFAIASDGAPTAQGQSLAQKRLDRIQALAQKGDANAQAALGMAYWLGEGVPRDNAETVKWFRKAADQGHTGAQFNLATMLQKGQGAPQNYAEAMALYRKAAAKGLPQAQFMIGEMYAEGQGVARNDTEAAKWYRQAAGKGYAEAQFRLGVLYAMEQGVPEDLVSAHMWLSLAERSGPRIKTMAAKTRASVAAQMSPQQIAAAEKLAAAWKPDGK